MRLEPRPKSVIEILRSARSILDWHALRTYYLAQRDWSASRRSRRSEAFGQPVPWWAYSCTSFLDQVVPPDAAVFELGAGGSTLWWLKRGNSVTTVESSPEWSSRVRDQAAEHVSRLKLISGNPDDSSFINEVLHGERFDVVVIDHSGDRSLAAETLAGHVRPNGIVVFDNSDREEYAAGLAHLTARGFKRLDFFGLSPINAFASRTSLFVEGSTLAIAGRPIDVATVEY